MTSGLCCDGLDGAPGIFSARYCGLTNDQDRRKMILKQLEGNPNRKASFHCSIVFYVAKDLYYHFEGECHGYIGLEERGTNGFGFDPIFYQADGKSFAEISSDEKFKVSHRGIAMRKFKEFIANDFSNK